jgi:hypothetical protein
MTNAFGVVLDSASVRRAAVEGVPETVIAAVRLLHKKSVDEVASKLRPDELGHVIRLVGRCPSCDPPGTLDALKARSHARSPERPSASTPTKPAAKGQAGHTTRADHPRRLETRTPIGVAHGANARQSPFERANGRRVSAMPNNVAIRANRTWLKRANDANDPNVWSGRALQENFVELVVSGLASMYPAYCWSVGSWPSWISARMRSHYRRGLNRTIWVTSVRMRREDRTSISSHPLADLGR